MRRPAMSVLLLGLLGALGTLGALVGCQVDAPHLADRAHDDDAGAEQSTEIGKPLAVVNSVVLKEAESCGFTIDTRRFVDETLVVLEGTIQGGERVRIRMESRTPATTLLTVSSLDDVSDAQLVQLLHAIRGKIWG